jgi:cyclase
MLHRRIVARIDVKGSNVVKGIHLEGLRIIGDPTEHAIRYQQQGADEILYLDLVASLYGRNNLVNIVRETAKNVFIPLTVGGGVRTIEDISTLLNAGADKVAMNTAALRRPMFITEAADVFGRQCVVVSIEAVRKGSSWEAYTENARQPEGVDAIEWIQDAVRAGAGEILITSIDRDGTRKGMDWELLHAVSRVCTVPYIFSGGVGSIDDVCRALEETDLPALAMASVLHYNTLTIEQVKHALRERNVSVREDSFSL